MDITTEPLENCQLRLTITVDEEQAQQAMQRAARQIAQDVNIPGFRKGKAPYELIVQHYGEERVRREAADLLAEEVYHQALEENDIHPFAPADLDDLKLHPLTFSFTIPLRPSVDVGKYRSYRLKPPRVKISRKEVREALEQIREQNAILEHVDRPAALGDSVVISLVARATQGEKVSEADSVRLVLEAGRPLPAPGFAEALVGMQAGEKRTLTLPLGDDFPEEELRGEEIEFTVDLQEVRDRTLPRLDDDLARSVGNYDSLRELTKQVRAELLQAAQEDADEEYATRVVEAIVEKAHVAYPPVMFEEALDDTVEDFERTVRKEMRLSLEDYLRLQRKSMEELRADLEPAARDDLRRALVLGEIARKEALDVDEEEIAQHIDAVSSRFGVRADDVRASLNSEVGRHSLRSRMIGSKAVQRLVAIARGEKTGKIAAKEREEKA